MIVATLAVALVAVLVLVTHLFDLARSRDRELEWLTADRNDWKRLALERQATMDQMRQDGFLVQRKATVTEPLDVESEGLRRAEAPLIARRADAHFIQAASKDLMKRNPRLSSSDAIKEAIRLRREVTHEDPPT